MNSRCLRFAMCVLAMTTLACTFSVKATIFRHEPTPAASPTPAPAAEESFQPSESFHPGVVMRPGDALRVSSKVSKGGVPWLEVKPRLAGYSPIGVPVRVQVHIPSPPPELSCPEVAIEWPDGTHSVAESDCAPCETAPCPDFESVARWRRFGASGEVKARVSQGKKSVVLTERVLISGGDDIGVER